MRKLFQAVSFIFLNFPFSAPGQRPALLLISIHDFYLPWGKVPLAEPEKALRNAALIPEQSRNEELTVIYSDKHLVTYKTEIDRLYSGPHQFTI
ncbi:MAG TPA: hypothetical protein PKX27_13350 [Bacteroidales bacterium]|nr:hypothetical protein [Bacteroidales bacterium]HPM88965.1 hypothetical protein [Bacteroidales bacterium]HQM70529.1 hypothetical protein [Bacteroidales bacterium]